MKIGSKFLEPFLTKNLSQHFLLQKRFIDPFTFERVTKHLCEMNNQILLKQTPVFIQILEHPLRWLHRERGNDGNGRLIEQRQRGKEEKEEERKETSARKKLSFASDDEPTNASDKQTSAPEVDTILQEQEKPNPPPSISSDSLIEEALVVARELCEISGERLGMTASQQTIFRALLKNRLQLVWGPPGTGKTHFLALSILCLMEVTFRNGPHSHTSTYGCPSCKLTIIIIIIIGAQA